MTEEHTCACGAFDIAVGLADEQRPRLVIVGGGFAGLYLAKSLKSADLQIVLLDRANFHTFQPLLYQVATAMLEPDSVASSFRRIFQKQENFHFRLVEVKSIDPEQKLVKTNAGCLSYDYLVIATGARPNYFGLRDIAEHGFFMKDVAQAIDIRQRLLKNFEKALLTDSLSERERLMNVVIVGGGATGIEIAGAIGELKNFILPYDYRELDLRAMRIHLIEATDRLMAGMSDKSSQLAAEALTNFGVQVWFNTKIVSYDGRTAITADGRQLHSGMLIWVAGVTGNIPPGLGRATVVPGGRLQVDEFNRVNGYDTLYAVGDVAAMVSPENPRGHPMLAPVAIQQARNLAHNLTAILLGHRERQQPFRYKNFGIMATIGRNRAIVERPGWTFGGFPAWLAWLFVHLLSIVGFRNKIIALINWAWNYLTYDRGIRLIISRFRDRDRGDDDCRL